MVDASLCHVDPPGGPLRKSDWVILPRGDWDRFRPLKKKHTKLGTFIPLYWLVHKNPENGFLQTPCKLVIQSPPIYLKNQDLFALLFGWISFVAQCSYYPIEKMSQTLWKFIWLFSCVNIFQQTSFRSKKNINIMSISCVNILI